MSTGTFSPRFLLPPVSPRLALGKGQRNGTGNVDVRVFTIQTLRAIARISSVGDSLATATATYLNITDISLRFLLCKSKKVRLKEAVINKLFGKMKFTEEFWALRDVSFQVKSGERLGIIGSNGAGKTSLLKMIAGIYPPTKGQIEICGDIAPLLDLGAGFDTEISARENILLYGSFLGQEIDGMRQRTDQIIEFAGIEQFADTPIKYFSKGMLLRLGFSVAT
ncbi:MAG TPA: ABC transporter ATP-binding protein, partial [Phycisphaerae bacterium]|nr:ABC transporter ATP-binding protein [Phycisphaerae bacterium]